MNDTPPIALSVSLSRKVNLGNYESADVFVSISGITPETTEAEIEAILDGPGSLAFGCIRKRLSAQCVVAKSK